MNVPSIVLSLTKLESIRGDRTTSHTHTHTHTHTHIIVHDGHAKNCYDGTEGQQ